jgi:site-specific recombinase XerD
MRRASDSGSSRASDSARLRPWAPDSERGATWAPDSDLRPARASDSVRAWAPRAWATSEQNQMLAADVALGRAADLFCAAKDAEGLSPRSIAWYAMILDRLVARFGPERAVDELAPAELRAWLVELRTHLAPVSIAGYVRGLRAFGNWLATDGLADARALRTLARPRVPHKVMEPLSDDDLRRLLAVADVRDRAILLLLLDTGLRVSEAAGISLGDLRADASIKVMGKGAKERIVPVGAASRGAIGRYLERRGPGSADEPLFVNQAGERLTLTGIQQLLTRLRARARVDARCNPHTFRHTFAHNYLVNGGDVFTLQRMLGHTSLEMVRRYVALADGDVALRHRSASPADVSDQRSEPPDPNHRSRPEVGGRTLTTTVTCRIAQRRSPRGGRCHDRPTRGYISPSRFRYYPLRRARSPSRGPAGSDPR